MSITRPSSLSPEEMDKLLERLANQGAKITMLDPRVTGAQAWTLATIGLTLVGVGGWGIKSINDLNTTMTRVVTQNEYRDQQLQRVEDHVKVLDDRIVVLERAERKR